MTREIMLDRPTTTPRLAPPPGLRATHQLTAKRHPPLPMITTRLGSQTAVKARALRPSAASGVVEVDDAAEVDGDAAVDGGGGADADAAVAAGGGVDVDADGDVSLMCLAPLGLENLGVPLPR
jgi:hypothetical protein